MAVEDDPLEVLHALMRELGEFVFGQGMPRRHLSYLVEVAGRRPRIYWPRVSLLRNVAG